MVGRAAEGRRDKEVERGEGLRGGPHKPLIILILVDPPHSRLVPVHTHTHTHSE